MNNIINRLINSNIKDIVLPIEGNVNRGDRVKLIESVIGTSQQISEDTNSYTVLYYPLSDTTGVVFYYRNDYRYVITGNTTYPQISSFWTTTNYTKGVYNYYYYFRTLKLNTNSNTITLSSQYSFSVSNVYWTKLPKFYKVSSNSFFFVYTTSNSTTTVPVTGFTFNGSSFVSNNSMSFYYDYNHYTYIKSYCLNNDGSCTLKTDKTLISGQNRSVRSYRGGWYTWSNSNATLNENFKEGYQGEYVYPDIFRINNNTFMAVYYYGSNAVMTSENVSGLSYDIVSSYVNSGGPSTLYFSLLTFNEDGSFTESKVTSFGNIYGKMSYEFHVLSETTGIFIYTYLGSSSYNSGVMGVLSWKINSDGTLSVSSQNNICTSSYTSTTQYVGNTRFYFYKVFKDAGILFGAYSTNGSNYNYFTSRLVSVNSSNQVVYSTSDVGSNVASVGNYCSVPSYITPMYNDGETAYGIIVYNGNNGWEVCGYKAVSSSKTFSIVSRKSIPTENGCYSSSYRLEFGNDCVLFLNYSGDKIYSLMICFDGNTLRVGTVQQLSSVDASNSWTINNVCKLSENIGAFLEWSYDSNANQANNKTTYLDLFVVTVDRENLTANAVKKQVQNCTYRRGYSGSVSWTSVETNVYMLPMGTSGNYINLMLVYNVGKYINSSSNYQGFSASFLNIDKNTGAITDARAKYDFPDDYTSSSLSSYKYFGRLGYRSGVFTYARYNSSNKYDMYLYGIIFSESGSCTVVEKVIESNRDSISTPFQDFYRFSDNVFLIEMEEYISNSWKYTQKVMKLTTSGFTDMYTIENEGTDSTRKEPSKLLCGEFYKGMLNFQSYTNSYEYMLPFQNLPNNPIQLLTSYRNSKIIGLEVLADELGNEVFDSDFINIDDANGFYFATAMDKSVGRTVLIFYQKNSYLCVIPVKLLGAKKASSSDSLSYHATIKQDAKDGDNARIYLK